MDTCSHGAHGNHQLWDGAVLVLSDPLPAVPLRQRAHARCLPDKEGGRVQEQMKAFSVFHLRQREDTGQQGQTAPRLDALSMPVCSRAIRAARDEERLMSSNQMEHLKKPRQVKGYGHTSLAEQPVRASPLQQKSLLIVAHSC